MRVAGIFVGGAARRMGGAPKGMLLSGGVPIAERLRDLAARAALEVVLVGENDAYRPLGVPAIADAQQGAGPLGGLVALLRYAEGRVAVALACDLPFVTEGLLERLISSEPLAVAVAPRTTHHWEPLFARYDARRCLPAATRALAAGRHALQPLLDEVGASPLLLSEAERTAMTDWDSPEDLP